MMKLTHTYIFQGWFHVDTTGQQKANDDPPVWCRDGWMFILRRDPDPAYDNLKGKV